MTVTPEQWEAVAADNNMTVDEMHILIDRIDTGDGIDDEPTLIERQNHPPTTFDRDGDPITLGQWSMLHGSTTYRFIRETILPNRHLVITIWQGVNEAYEMPPVVFGTAVFHLTDPDATELPASVRDVSASSETVALIFHDEFVSYYSHLNEET